MSPNLLQPLQSRAVIRSCPKSSKSSQKASTIRNRFIGQPISNVFPSIDDDRKILGNVRKPNTGPHHSKYIAVSHAWAYSLIPQNATPGLYRINSSCAGTSRRCKIRDEVLDRVIQYAKHHDVTLLWIDIECLDQTDKQKHQMAMDSMDLVYSYSSYPLGLLGTVLRTQNEVNLLQDLISGAFTCSNNSNDPPMLESSVSEGVAMEVFELLERLSSDHWWHRRWIFQEEYRSSTKMRLLIRHNPEAKKRREFGSLYGEICISPVVFRTHATLFLYAYERQGKSKWRGQCARMREIFGRYSVIYQFSPSANAKAMSSRIFADIGRRNSKEAFDILPIAANSCNYPRRLLSKILATQSYSLSMCILALYLLNGKIIRNDPSTSTIPPRLNIFEYLDIISFDEFRPPVDSAELSFLKTARFAMSYFPSKASDHGSPLGSMRRDPYRQATESLH